MKTFSDQVSEHIIFLQGMGLEAHTLEVGRFVRSYKVGQIKGRGEYAYHCRSNEMQKGYIGLQTWCRGFGGKEETYKTYGLPPNALQETPCYNSKRVEDNGDARKDHETAARKAYGFWEHSELIGVSSYLERKGVGAYGIRFRNTINYGNAAVVPMLDENGKLWSCQILNQDGSKRIMAGTRAKGLFHKLKEPIDGLPIGIAESYVTAASCVELGEIPTVCCFSADNMPSVALSIRNLYPKSPLILFADNDRHLEEKGLPNKGLLMAQKTTATIRQAIFMVEPDFTAIEPLQEASDWNDLARIKGAQVTRVLIQEKIRRTNG